MPTELELIARLLIAGVLGGLIGFEREVSDQPAGFRTHILVALGACLFALASAFGFDALLSSSPRTVLDPSRIAAQIVSGIGFLGAGAIILHGTSVRGLTTAASLWVVAAIGMAIAFGMYVPAAVTTAAVLLALWGLRRVRIRFLSRMKREHEELELEADPTMHPYELVESLAERGIEIEKLSIQRAEGRYRLSLLMKLPPKLAMESVVSEISERPGVRQVEWSG